MYPKEHGKFKAGRWAIALSVAWLLGASARPAHATNVTVQPYDPAGTSGEAATIEYAVRGLGVKDVIVCGHTRCGAMRAVLEPDQLNDMPRVRRWLANADTSREIALTQYAHLTEDARWQVMAQENVLVQLENLRTHPAVLVGLANGQLRLHAWVYELEAGRVFTYDPETGQYVPLIRADGTGVITPINRNGFAPRALSPTADAS